jgi:hypothetical protein
MTTAVITHQSMGHQTDNVDQILATRASTYIITVMQLQHGGIARRGIPTGLRMLMTL